MKKFLTTFALYNDLRQTLYEQFIRPRFAKYAEMHGMKFVELNNDNFIENAPQELVNQQRERSNYLSNEINNLEIQHKEITKLI